MDVRRPPILLSLRPSLFIAVRASARELGVSVVVYITAVLMHITGMRPGILTETPDEIRRHVRG